MPRYKRDGHDSDANASDKVNGDDIYHLIDGEIKYNNAEGGFAH